MLVLSIVSTKKQMTKCVLLQCVFGLKLSAKKPWKIQISDLLLALPHECTPKKGYFSIEWSKIRNLNVRFFSFFFACLFGCLFVCLFFSWRKERRYTFQVRSVIGDQDNRGYNSNNTRNLHNNRSYRLQDLKKMVCKSCRVTRRNCKQWVPKKPNAKTLKAN